MSLPHVGVTWRPPEGFEPNFHLEAWPTNRAQMLRFTLLTDKPCRLAFPESSFRHLPAWASDVLPVLIDMEAGRRGLEVTKVGFDMVTTSRVVILGAVCPEK